MVSIKVFFIMVFLWFGFVYWILHRDYMKKWRMKHHIGKSRDI